MKNIINTPKKGLILLLVFCLVLVTIRVLSTQTILYTFFLWNLFLALMPYFISSKMKSVSIKSLAKWKLFLWLFSWMLFFPNAHYIVTDFIHLHNTSGTQMWFDMLIMISFSVAGLLLAVISINHIYLILKTRWRENNTQLFIIFSCLLSGFGIYLGRFLRFNSWDILTSPISLIKSSILSVNDPKAWVVTFGFGVFIYILFLLFTSFDDLKNHS